MTEGTPASRSALLAACGERFQDLAAARSTVRRVLETTPTRWQLWLAGTDQPETRTIERLHTVMTDFLNISTPTDLAKRPIGILLTTHKPLLDSLKHLNAAKQASQTAVASYRAHLQGDKSAEEAFIDGEWFTKGHLQPVDSADLRAMWPDPHQALHFQPAHRAVTVLPYPVSRWVYWWDTGVKRSVSMNLSTARALVNNLPNTAAYDPVAYRVVLAGLNDNAPLRRVRSLAPQLKVRYRLEPPSAEKHQLKRRASTRPGHGITVLPQDTLPSDFNWPESVSAPAKAPIDETVYQPVVPKLGLYLHIDRKKRGPQPKNSENSHA